MVENPAGGQVVHSLSREPAPPLLSGFASQAKPVGRKPRIVAIPVAALRRALSGEMPAQPRLDRRIPLSGLPQNSWVEIWGNRLRRFPWAPSCGFFPLTAVRKDPRAKPALGTKPVAADPPEGGLALFSVTKPMPECWEASKATHRFC
jgi:hypothetical protein